MGDMATTPSGAGELPDDEALRRGDVDPHVLASAGLAAELIVDIRRLVGVMDTFAAGLLATDQRVKELADLRGRNRRLTVVVAVLIGLLTLAVLAAIVGGVIFVSRLTTIAEGNAANGNVLVECTTPSPPATSALDPEDRVHECYERNLAAQGQAIDSIGNDMLDAAICARTEADVDRIADCFRARRAARTPGGP